MDVLFFQRTFCLSYGRFMWLPTPSDKAVKEFQALVLAHSGLVLEHHQAKASATRLLHLHFIKSYENSSLCKKVDRERR